MGVLRKRTHHKNTTSSHGGKKAKKHPTTTIGSLPKDLLVDILARVGSSSLTDLFNAKQCCKEFLEASKEQYVIQHISIFDKLMIWNPNDNVLSFLNNCLNQGNPGSLFSEGITEYFKLGKVDSGLEYLKLASEKKHTEATYAYGMILLSQGDKWSEQGLKMLNSMKHSLSRYWDVCDSRDKVKRILRLTWINNNISDFFDMKCQKEGHGLHRLRRLEFREDEEIESCEYCMWYRELILFRRMLNICDP